MSRRPSTSVTGLAHHVYTVAFQYGKRPRNGVRIGRPAGIGGGAPSPSSHLPACRRWRIPLLRTAFNHRRYCRCLPPPDLNRKANGADPANLLRFPASPILRIVHRRQYKAATGCSFGRASEVSASLGDDGARASNARPARAVPTDRAKMAYRFRPQPRYCRYGTILT